MDIVARLTIGQIKEGDSVSFEHTVTAGQIDEFARLTGDVSPLHVDKSFAAGRGYPDRVAHGMLLAGLFSRLVGVHMPGENALLQMANLKFHEPVHPGDTLEVRGKVSQVSPGAGAVVIQATITNKRTGACSASAKIQTGLTARAEK